MTFSSRTALVLFSGGQDSTTCLAWALKHYDNVETVSFDYGQRHRVELTCCALIRERLIDFFPEYKKKLGQDHLIPIEAIAQISETSLTQEAEIHIAENGLPNTFVPGRNLLFLTFAAAIAYRRNISTLIGGMCETDFSGYPDCREDTIKSLQDTLNLGMNSNLIIETPLMHLNKMQTWALAEELGGTRLIDIIRENTHTCYLGQRDHLHEWGYGCGACPACTLRQRGYQHYINQQH